MSSKSANTTRRKRTCHHCKSSYIPSRSDQKFCSDACRYKAKSEKQSKANRKKLERRVSRLRRTGFGQYLVRECIRAGTVQILTGHTPETLHELAKLRTDCFIYNGVSLDGELFKAYELSHICPVNGHSIVGLLHPHNLVIASKAFNRSRSKRYMGGGKWIERNKLLPQWRVDVGRPQKLSATPDLSGTVLPLCPIPNSALKNAPPFKSVMPKASACAGSPA